MKKNRFAVSAATLLSAAGLAQAQFVETFDVLVGGPLPAASYPAGWTAQNNSVPGLTNWFPGNLAVFGPAQGTGYLAANFNNTTGLNTISNWLITPVISLTNGAELTFFTRTYSPPTFPDRIQVRMNMVNTGTNVGTLPEDVGDFTELLLDINPTYTIGTVPPAGYPDSWTQLTATVTGVTGTVSGRLAFRYFTEGGGPAGLNSDYIGIDAAAYTLTASPTGACCFIDGSCQVLTATACAFGAGNFAGNGVTCAAANCPPPPTGACCAFDGSCQVLTAAQCTAAAGTYAGNNITCLAANCPAGHIEVGEAGNLPGTAQIIGGSGGLPGIQGTLDADDVDMYQINICDEANFGATAVGGATFDTQLWLFNTSGAGVVFNDDSVGFQSTLTSALVAANGNYLLAISGYDNDALDSGALELWLDTPYAGERAPDGPGAANPVAGWSGVGASGPYTIFLTGSCRVGGDFGACCLGAPSYSCSIMSPAACLAAGGSYAGNGVTCANANCPPAPTGACCNVNGCTIVSEAACLAAGGTYAGNNITCAAANCPPATMWLELGEAGDLPGTAQTAAGSGTLQEIRGGLGSGDADMYRIDVCNAANFSASTVGGTTVDTQLFMFKLDGTGVTHDDDNPAGGLQSVLSNTFVGPAGNGQYYLAVSQYNKDAHGVSTNGLIWANTPFNVERAPDGPAAAEAIGSWDVTVGSGGTYSIVLTGSCFIPSAPSCYANCDGSTGTPALTGNDFACFITAYANNESYANCDGSTGTPALTGNDFACFITAYAAGCS